MVIATRPPVAWLQSAAICFRALSQIEFSGTTDASLMATDFCADDVPAPVRTSAEARPSATIDSFSG